MSLIDFLVQSNRLSIISSSVSCHFIEDFLILLVKSCITIAAETEMFKLSVKPTIGIFK